MSLELTLPIVVIASLLLLVWDDFARMLERARRDETVDEFDEDTTLEEWVACFPERHLTLLDRPEAQ